MIFRLAKKTTRNGSIELAYLSQEYRELPVENDEDVHEAMEDDGEGEDERGVVVEVDGGVPDRPGQVEGRPTSPENGWNQGKKAEKVSSERIINP